VYSLSKRVISKYIRGECKRRLRLDLYAGKGGRDKGGAPDKDSMRPGLALLTEQGREFERRCFRELEEIFGTDRVLHGGHKPYEEGEERALQTISLAQAIDRLSPGVFLLEAEYAVCDGFKQAHGLDKLCHGLGYPDAKLGFSANRPDIIHAIAPGDQPRRIIQPNGDIVTLKAGSSKVGLRLIDIKLTSEPSPAYFAELAYYGMTLADWLEDNGYGDQFVVLADAAIWPGKHDGSSLKRREREDAKAGIVTKDLNTYLKALEKDLETMPAEVVLGRVIRFLSVDLPEVVAPEQWQDLDWHIDSRCIGCDYLGYEWASSDKKAAKDNRYCWPTAEASGHLSRIVGLTEGACGKLAQYDIRQIRDLSSLAPGHEAFESHQALKATRHLVHARAEALTLGLPAALPKRSGTSAVMPRYSDVRVALSVDFDVGSGLAFALGYEIVANIPTSLKVEPDGKTRLERRPERRQRVMLVPEKTLDKEGEIFTEVLGRLQYDLFELEDEIKSAFRTIASDDRYKPSVQFYLWDRLTFDHLCRMMGRHLLRIRNPVTIAKKTFSMAPMAWIFPPEQVVEDADNTSRNSPITIVSEVVRLLAINIPHHYSQIQVANAYRPPPRDGTKPYEFRLHAFFMDPLSDQIPSERGHEVWNEASPFKTLTYQEYQDRLRAAVREKLSATLSVARRLAMDLKKTLAAQAPAIANVFGRGKRLDAIATDNQIVYQHARLMDAADRLEVDLLMAMPPFEREARFASVRLEGLLEGRDRIHTLEALDLTRQITNPDVFVFRMSDRSREAKVKVGDFNLSLMPEDRLEWQHRSVASLKGEYTQLRFAAPLDEDKDYRATVREACKATVLAFDRVKRVVVVETTLLFRTLVQLGLFDIRFDPGARRWGIIDPLHADYFVRPRLKKALQAIGVPPLSITRPLAKGLEITRSGVTKPRRGDPVPAERFIWDADTLAQEASPWGTTTAMGAIVALERPYNDSQVDAINRALTRRLTLLWGPPGTGKSATAVAMIVGLIAEASIRRVPIRIAITGPTWVAIDNVMAELPQALRTAGFDGQIGLTRLMSDRSSPASVDPRLHDVIVTPAENNEPTQLVIRDLRAGARSSIVAGTANQLAQLAKMGGGGTQEFFDFMLIDEASQMDVAHAMVAFTTLAEGASVTVVGDDKQMSPIHPIDPPVGAEHLVGSIYDFYRQYRKGEPTQEGIEPTMLEINYRSNKEIVEFIRYAGYNETLKAGNPDLRVRLTEPLPSTLAAPTGWSSELPWSEHYATILDPEQPLTAVIHPDRYSSQRNDEEAKLVAALVTLLRGRLLPLDPKKNDPLDDITFFEKGIGVVTPHRAQQSAVVHHLERALRPSPQVLEALMGSVDTVERFQGQQKIAMIASFGLGDADQIAAEEEFLYSLNRFNVIASRAQAKLIVIMSRKMADYLPRDLVALRQSRLLKHYVDGHLRTSVSLMLPELQSCELKLR